MPLEEPLSPIAVDPAEPAGTTVSYFSAPSAPSPMLALVRAVSMFAVVIGALRLAMTPFRLKSLWTWLSALGAGGADAMDPLLGLGVAGPLGGLLAPAFCSRAQHAAPPAARAAADGGLGMGVPGVGRVRHRHRRVVFRRQPLRRTGLLPNVLRPAVRNVPGAVARFERAGGRRARPDAVDGCGRLV